LLLKGHEMSECLDHLSDPMGSGKMRAGALNLAAVVAVSAGLMSLSATEVAAQSLCTTYTVALGDTLSGIAGTAGVRGGFQVLFNANTGVLSSPNLLEVGQVLTIPCEDGRLPASRVPQVAAVAPAAPAAPAVRSIRFLTGSGYAPFTDEDLPGGGLYTELVTRAMELGNPDQEFRVIFVNDWGSHLTELLPTGAFDAGFPWFLPDCTKVDNLSESNAIRCTEFDASAPFYDALVGYYTLKDSPYVAATTPQQLYGATLCRPDGWFSFDLEAVELVAPNIELVFAANEEKCWELLQKGEVDVVTYDALPAEDDYTDMGMTDSVVNLSALATKETMHVLIPKTNPNSAVYLATLNAGLEQLRLSGEWFEVVRRQIQATVEN